MDPAVRQYEIELSQPSGPWVKRIIWFCALADFAFIAWSVVDAILHSPHQPLIDALFVPVVLWLLLVFGSRMRLQPKMIVSLGSDFIESRIRSAWFRCKKRIRRSEVKSISENERGLTIMDRGQFGAWLLGFVFVPATMPGYPEIKSILSGWAPVQIRQ